MYPSPTVASAGPGLDLIDSDSAHPEVLDIPAAPSLNDARRLLREFWGHDEFRPGQDICIEAALQGRDVVAILPTGAGKSLVYQMTALLKPNLTLVISPLISLMKDQIDGLQARGLPATFVNSSLRPTEAEDRMAAVAAGRIKLLYISPERFNSITFRERIRSTPISMIAIDEAHCLSEWGHDFRPAYMRINSHRNELFPNAQIMALTATATPQVRADIIDHLGIENPFVHVGGFDRPNIDWGVRDIHVDNLAELDREKIRNIDELLEELAGHQNATAIIYTGTRNSAEKIAAAVALRGFRTMAYHGGQNTGDRDEAQESFMDGDVDVVVATSAFGMGVDKDNVRLVIHYQIPGTIEAYYQEAGRAGRDGHPCRCVLLFNEADRELQENFISLSHPARPWYRLVYSALLAHIDEDGFAVHRDRKGSVRTTSTGQIAYMTRSDLIRAENWPMFNPVSSVLLSLHDAGIIDYTSGASTGIYVKLEAGPERIAEVLDLPRCHEDHRLTMRELWKIGGGTRLFDGVMLRERHLGHFQVGSKQLKKTLRYMEGKEVLRWKSLETRIQVLKPHLDPERLPLPWNALDRRRNRELKKLQTVIDYANRTGCRRIKLLSYFGDDSTPSCTGCDNCRRSEERS